MSLHKFSLYISLSNVSLESVNRLHSCDKPLHTSPPSSPDQLENFAHHVPTQVSTLCYEQYFTKTFILVEPLLDNSQQYHHHHHVTNLRTLLIMSQHKFLLYVMSNILLKPSYRLNHCLTTANNIITIIM